MIILIQNFNAIIKEEKIVSIDVSFVVSHSSLIKDSRGINRYFKAGESIDVVTYDQGNATLSKNNSQIGKFPICELKKAGQFYEKNKDRARLIA